MLILSVCLSVLLASSFGDLVSDPLPSPTSLPPTTSSSGLGAPECFCFPCSLKHGSYNVHTQNQFCDSAAVIQGRVTAIKIREENYGMWNSPAHVSLGGGWAFLPRHYEVGVRVMVVYRSEGHLIEQGDKVLVRYSMRPDCPACETLVEDHDPHSQARLEEFKIVKGNRYVFFLPAVSSEHGNKVEAVLDQCSRVWRYTKRDNNVPGYIPLSKRDLLTSTLCDKCRVTGCHQDRCVAANSVEECGMNQYALQRTWDIHSCYMAQGICYFNQDTDLCEWTSVNEKGIRKTRLENCPKT